MGKKLALIISILGLFISFLLFFVSKDKVGFFGIGENGQVDSGFDMTFIGLFFSFVVLVIFLALFIIYKIKDITIHPSHKKEMFRTTTILAISLVLGLIFAVFDWGEMKMADGSVYSAAKTWLIEGGLYAVAIGIIMAIGLALYGALIKK